MKEKNLIPALRFKGFTETWEQRKLGLIFEEFSKKSKEENEYPVLSSTNTGMEHRKGRVSGKSNVGYKIIETGDLVLSPQNLWLGNININNLGTGLVSPSYRTYKIRELISDFIRPQLKTDRMIAEYKYASTQGASVVRRNLDLDRFNDIQIKIPGTVEQQSIGSFFSTLDHLITLQQRELESLKAAKKTLLSKMFPKKGETIPEVRFPGFTDAWEQRKLGELCESFEYGLNVSAKEYDGKNKYLRITDIDDETRRFLYSNLTSPNIDINEASEYLLKTGAILFSRTGASVGKTYLYDKSDGDVYYAGFLIKAQISNNYSPEFVFQNTLTNRYLQFVQITSQRSGQPGINAQEYANYCLEEPSLQEQQSIGSFFSTLDHLITLQQRKLELLKMQKQTLLKLMFPR